MEGPPPPPPPSSYYYPQYYQAQAVYSYDESLQSAQPLITIHQSEEGDIYIREERIKQLRKEIEKEREAIAVREEERKRRIEEEEEIRRLEDEAAAAAAAIERERREAEEAATLERERQETAAAAILERGRQEAAAAVLEKAAAAATIEREREEEEKLASEMEEGPMGEEEASTSGTETCNILVNAILSADIWEDEEMLEIERWQQDNVEMKPSFAEKARQTRQRAREEREREAIKNSGEDIFNLLR